MGRIPFTLCVMANSTAAEIYNLAYMGFILTAYILSCVEIRCVNVSICIADHIGGMLLHFNYKSTIKKWWLRAEKKKRRPKKKRNKAIRIWNPIESE